MSSPGLELQGAVAAALKAASALQALIGNPIRLYMDVPPLETWPGAYVTIGEAQQLVDKAECIDGSEIYLDLHVWSRASGDMEIKAIASAICDVLDEADLTLDHHRCVLIERDTIRFLRDPDNLTRHAVLTFRALTEPMD